MHQEGTVRYRATGLPGITVRGGQAIFSAEHAVFTLEVRTDATVLEVEAGEVRVILPGSPLRRFAAGQRFVIPTEMALPPTTVEAFAERRPNHQDPPLSDEPPVIKLAAARIEPAQDPTTPATQAGEPTPVVFQVSEDAAFAKLVQGLLDGVAEAPIARPAGSSESL